ncbi:MAG TPA: aminofutalosine synthase MqnE [Candidatus Tripitaka californicus]|uniref:aminofutalosine synthase MqnE n=1 Tax=Candidatus Tripitaka californicus TaxID=3367616 RepID=UPI00402943BF|nr:aminofutalosine synthase MqnE [Planctomycetota bacterium]
MKTALETVPHTRRHKPSAQGAGPLPVELLEKVEAGGRLDLEEAVRLYGSNDLLLLGQMANTVKERKSGNKVYYIVNRHINYTNVCKNRCRFCAFSKEENQAGGYTMSVEEVLEKAEGVVEQGATEVHVVGGLHPHLGLDYYLKMLSRLHEKFPSVHLQAFTAVEVAHIAQRAGLSVRDTLKELAQAGLDSLPGGGAEVFSPRIRKELCPDKLSGEDWLTVMRQAHGLGLRSNATMLYGHLETPIERIRHLLALRDLQDETGGFMSFIPLAFHSDNTFLQGLPRTTADLDLRTLAISRLLLDNFPHIKAFWVMLGVKLAQVSLSFGVDDIDGTVIQEKITHSAGADTPEELSVGEIVRLIEEAGREPVERDTLYRRVVRPRGRLGSDWRIED